MSEDTTAGQEELAEAEQHEPVDLFEGLEGPTEEEATQYLRQAEESAVMAVFCDHRASTIKLGETVYDIVSTFGIEKVLLDLESQAGVAIAEHLKERGIAYGVFGYDGQIFGIEGSEHLVAGVDGAVEQVELDPKEVGLLEARIVIVPALQANSHESVDMKHPQMTSTMHLSPDTRPGIVFDRCRAIGRGALVIDAPEDGLVSIPLDQEVLDGSEHLAREAVVSLPLGTGGTVYRRRVAHLRNQAQSQGTTLRLPLDEDPGEIVQQQG